MAKYPLLNLRGSSYEIAEARISGDKKRIVEDNIIVDYGCFKKDKGEKMRLKAAKAQCKLDELRKVICK